jgi:HD-like signal output (HDOD) protein
MHSVFDAATKQIGVEPLAPPESASGDRWIGRRIGNYIVDRPLARGGMGSVYVARHPQLGREVAVKFLAQDVSSQPELAARFLAEARVTASLNHPNIVEILDFGELDGELYYAMELLRGKSLRAVMREQGRLSGAAMQPYVEQICRALEAAHAAGIVHRDLKPANVLVLEGEPLRLKLLDFGVAKLMTSGPAQTRAGQVLGTATHMAPEQALGDPTRVTPQSDLYSLGVIAYEMLTGAPVFQHESDVMLMVMHVRDAVRPIRERAPDVPDAVARLVEACLAKDPAARPAGARALAEALARALATPHRPPLVVVRADAAPPSLPLAERPTRLASTVPPPALSPAVTPPVAARAPVAPAAPEDATAKAEATIQTLLSRLQRRGDFPAFARTVGEVSHKADANGAFSAGQLGESILKDYALTAKLLRVVNANYARRFGGRIYSIQHAIVILGFDRVRSLALTISLFKTSGTGKEPERVSESAISALVSSEIARNLAPEARVSDDEATVCAMFKNLGRHLVLVHLPELFDRIQGAVESEGLEVSLAAKRVLGISFEDLGAAVAKSWQLPQQVVKAMSGELREGKLERSEDRLNSLAAFSNELCDVITRSTPEERERAVRELLAKHKNLVTLDTESVDEMLAHVEGSLGERYASLLGADLKSSRFVANVSHAASPARAIEVAGRAAAPAADLAECILQVKQSLERGHSSDAVLGMALRAVADHLGARAPLILTAAPNRQHLVLRYGLRDDLDGLRRELKFPLRASGPRAQYFASAYHSGKDALVKDCFEKESAEALPPAYFELLGSPALAIYACHGKAVMPALLVVEAEGAADLPDPARIAELAELRPLIARAAAR